MDQVMSAGIRASHLDFSATFAHRMSSRPGFPVRMTGWAMAEYLAVLTGLMGVWMSAPTILQWIHEHYDKFSWALMLPF